jgi:hypothetical protein
MNGRSIIDYFSLYLISRNNLLILILATYDLSMDVLKAAQRLVAQALGHLLLGVAILAGILKTHSNVRSRSLGQVACSHVLGGHRER